MRDEASIRSLRNQFATLVVRRGGMYQLGLSLMVFGIAFAILLGVLALVHPLGPPVSPMPASDFYGYVALVSSMVAFAAVGASIAGRTHSPKTIVADDKGVRMIKKGRVVRDIPWPDVVHVEVGYRRLKASLVRAGLTAVFKITSNRPRRSISVNAIETKIDFGEMEVFMQDLSSAARNRAIPVAEFKLPSRSVHSRWA